MWCSVMFLFECSLIPLSSSLCVYLICVDMVDRVNVELSRVRIESVGWDLVGDEMR